MNKIDAPARTFNQKDDNVPSQKPRKYKCRGWHTKLPYWLLHFKPPMKPLRPTQRLILQTIADRCSWEPVDKFGSIGFCIIGYERLGQLVGLKYRAIIENVGKLIEMGMLWRMSTGGINWDTGEAKANCYCIPGSPNAPKPTFEFTVWKPKFRPAGASFISPDSMQKAHTLDDSEHPETPELPEPPAQPHEPQFPRLASA